jgi:hypothetical protein
LTIWLPWMNHRSAQSIILFDWQPQRAAARRFHGGIAVRARNRFGLNECYYRYKETLRLFSVSTDLIHKAPTTHQNPTTIRFVLSWITNRRSLRIPIRNLLSLRDQNEKNLIHDFWKFVAKVIKITTILSNSIR